MRHVVPGFVHRPGLHCGSTAMADALRTVGLDLPEEMALGLGAGPAFLWFEGPGLSPSRFFLGRSVSFEHDLCDRLGLLFDEVAVAGTDEAWRQIKARLDAGRVVLALTDLRYLPYFGSRTHFNGHRVVVAGYDDEAGTALLADSHFEGLRDVPLEDLARALASDAPPLTSTDCFFGSLSPPASPPDLRAAARDAVRANAAQMLAPSEAGGVGGVEQLARSLPSWSTAPDAAWCARFAAQVIEKRGNGGGLFRRMYARFLHDAAFECLVPLALEAARTWTSLAEALRVASEQPAPDFAEAAARARTVAAAERALWTAARAG